MVKLVDVAKEANASVATVSRALNNNDRVDPQLRRRPGRYPVGVPTQLPRPQPSPTAHQSLVAHHLRHRERVLHLRRRGVEDVAVDNGFSVVLCNADEDEGKEARYAELAVAEQAAGVIISPHSSRTDLRPLTAARIPVVVVDRELDGGFDTVTSDSRAGRASGDRAPARSGLGASGLHHGTEIGPDGDAAPSRLRGGVAGGRGSARPASPTRHSRSTAAALAAGRLLGSARAPDALFVGNAALGLGVLQELRRRGLRPGRDIGLICFDDAPWAPFIDPPISVIAQPVYRMGTNAASMLIGRIGGAVHRLADSCSAPIWWCGRAPESRSEQRGQGEGHKCDRWVFWGPFRPRTPIG